MASAPDVESPAGRLGVAAGLVLSMLWVGTIGFGGGSALIPVVEKELVDRRRYLSGSVYTRHTIVANITPGALPVKLAAAAGHTLAGWRLAIAGAIAVCLPGVVGTLGMLTASSALGDTGLLAVSRASVGISAFIVVLLIGYIWKVHSQAGRRLLPYVLISAVSALLTGANQIASLLGSLVGVTVDLRLPTLSAVQLIGLALIAIATISLLGARGARGTDHPKRSARRELGPVWKSMGAFFALAVVGVVLFGAVGGVSGLSLAGLVAFSTVSSFGGGEAYIGVADGYFVQSGLIDQQAFYTQLVPIANALPGPILVKVAAGAGFVFGAGSGTPTAWLLGLAAALIAIGSCCALAIPVLGMFEDLRHHPTVVAIDHYILPVICGLLVSVSATMLQVSAAVGLDAGVPPMQLQWVSLGAIAAMTYLHLRQVVPGLAMLLGAGVVSLVILGV